MKHSITSLILILGGFAASTAHAQWDPGTYSNLARYTIEDVDSNLLGYVYVPQIGHADVGEVYWTWSGTPWDETFEIAYLDQVSSYTLPGGWTEEVYETDSLTSGGVPGGTLDHDWKVTRSDSSVAVYVEVGASTLGWWSPDGLSYFSTTDTYTFTEDSGSISSSSISTGYEGNEL